MTAVRPFQKLNEWEWEFFYDQFEWCVWAYYIYSTRCDVWNRWNEGKDLCMKCFFSRCRMSTEITMYFSRSETQFYRTTLWTLSAISEGTSTPLARFLTFFSGSVGSKYTATTTVPNRLTWLGSEGIGLQFRCSSFEADDLSSKFLQHY